MHLDGTFSLFYKKSKISIQSGAAVVSYKHIFMHCMLVKYIRVHSLRWKNQLNGIKVRSSPWSSIQAVLNRNRQTSIYHGSFTCIASRVTRITFFGYINPDITYNKNKQIDSANRRVMESKWFSITMLEMTFNGHNVDLKEPDSWFKKVNNSIVCGKNQKRHLRSAWL